VNHSEKPSAASATVSIVSTFVGGGSRPFRLRADRTRDITALPLNDVYGDALLPSELDGCHQISALQCRLGPDSAESAPSARDEPDFVPMLILFTRTVYVRTRLNLLTASYASLPPGGC
jgi:hypothetical protein